MRKDKDKAVFQKGKKPHTPPSESPPCCSAAAPPYQSPILCTSSTHQAEPNIKKNQHSMIKDLCKIYSGDTIRDANTRRPDLPYAV